MLRCYQPTPWLFSGDLHTVWGMKNRGRSDFKPLREDVDFEDGGQVTIEYFMRENLSEKAPILFIIHTMGGGSREPCTNWAAFNFMNKGFRVIICSCRGCNGSKLKTKRICDSSNYEDTHVIVEHISSKYPSAEHKFMLGFSMGAIIAVNYCTVYDDIDAAVSVSHVIDNKRADVLLMKGIRGRLFAKPLINALTRIIKKSPLYSEEEKRRIYAVKTSAEFHDLVSAKNMGLKSSDEYYELTKLYGKPKKVKVPTLILSSEDDPLISRDFLNEEEFTDKSNEKCAFVFTKEGGHVSFCKGWSGMESYAEEVAEEFFYLVAKMKS